MITKYVCFLDDDDQKKMFSIENKNSCIVVENGKTWIHSKYNGKTRRDYIKIKLSLNKSVSYTLFNLIPDTLGYAKSLSDKPLYLGKDTFEKIKSIINNTIILYMLFKNIEQRIFNFVAGLFIKLLSFHCFINDNKKFSFAFLIYSLALFGYYVKWSSQNYKK